MGWKDKMLEPCVAKLKSDLEKAKPLKKSREIQENLFKECPNIPEYTFIVIDNTERTKPSLTLARFREFGDYHETFFTHNYVMLGGHHLFLRDNIKQDKPRNKEIYERDRNDFWMDAEFRLKRGYLCHHSVEDIERMKESSFQYSSNGHFFIGENALELALKNPMIHELFAKLCTPEGFKVYLLDSLLPE